MTVSANRSPSVFTLLDDGLAYVKEGDARRAGPARRASPPFLRIRGRGDRECAEECPGECIFIEQG